MLGSIGLDTHKLKNSLKKYGRTGLYTYIGLSTLVTTGFYIAIEQKVDVKKIVGIKDGDPDEEPSWVQKVFLGPGSHLALAILCSKACIPIKVPIAAALTPYVHKLEQRLLHKVAQGASQTHHS
eukprot:GHRR01009758.1.p2 GENE.GHRR01009758.1~~GHRR01009758.1.p2  ORF type:complete len:124 (+),score=17.19 GHRR01009758.1:208-579(+)